MDTITRRGFVRATGVIGVGAMAGWGILAAGAERKKLRLGLVGGGARGQQLLKDGLLGSDEFDVVAAADVYRPNLLTAIRLARLANAGVVLDSPFDTPSDEQRKKVQAATAVKAYESYGEMLANENIDAVLIATPPSTHKAMIFEGLGAGKHIFCETPMATTVADARDIVSAASESNRIVQIGHQRRYHPNYNLVMKHLKEHYPFGRPIQIETYHHENTHGRRPFAGGQEITPEGRKQVGSNLDSFVNWRNYVTAGEGPCLEALPRSLDTANWFGGAIPARVFASGGIEYWRDGRTTPDNVNVVLEYRMDPSSEQFVHMASRYAGQESAALNSAYTLRATFSFSLCTSQHGIHERVISDRATAVLNLYGDNFFLLESMHSSPPELKNEHRRLLGSKLAERLAAMTEAERNCFVLTHGASYDLPGYFAGARTTAPILAVGSEESAEVHQFRAFAAHIREGGVPRANVMVGLAAVIVGESAQYSLDLGLPLDIDPALMKFDFETPSIVGFDAEARPIPDSMEVY